MSKNQGRRYAHGNEHGVFAGFSRPSGRCEAQSYNWRASKVLQCSTWPLSRPRVNQRTRWAELPWVKESGTTTPRDCFCSASSPMAEAAARAASTSPCSRICSRWLVRLAHTPARLVLFEGATPTACGTGQSATGPFYCPPDQKVYIDLSFFRLMQQRFNVSGEFPQAYVIAHEVGHHVQNLLGIAEKVTRLQRQASQTEGNALSVRVELQADCLAGVWGYHAKQDRNLIEPGDFEAGLRAASAIGDDRLQHKSQGSVQPETWTHGSSEQRTTWLRRGLETGDPNVCNTFTGTRL